MEIRQNKLVEMASEAERPTRWWLGWLVAFGIIAGLGAAGQGIGSLVLGHPQSDELLHQYEEAFMFGVTLLGLWAWLRFKERRAFSSVGFRGARPLGRFLLGAGIGAGMITVVVLILLATGQYDTGASEHTRSGAEALLPLIPLAALFALQGSTEEAVTRGYMLQIAGRQLPAWAAIVGSSVFFAVVHVDFHPIVLVNITLFALMASFLVLAQRSLWLVCGIHAAWNYAMGNIYGAPVSGNPEAVSFFSLGPAAGSSESVTGGLFGPEGGIVVTAVWLVGTIVAFVIFRRSADSTPDSQASERVQAG